MARETTFNVQHHDVTGGRLFPITDMTPEALAMIPLGSEVVLVGADGSAEDGDWSAESRAKLMAAAREFPEEAGDYFIFYLPPLVQEFDAVLTAIGNAGYTREYQMYTAVKSGELTPSAFAAILRDVAHEAQKEVMPS